MRDRLTGTVPAVAALLGLVVAAAYGTADFLGGRATRVSSPWTIVLATHAIGLVAVTGYAIVLGADTLTLSDVALGAGAGLAGVAGLACLYRGLAVGRASVVAPLSAVGSAVLEVSWGLARGERPGPVALAGVALALVAVAIVAGAPDHGAVTRVSRATELALGSGAAVLLGAFLVLLSGTGSGSGLWPVVISRAAPIPLLAVGLATLRRPLRVPRADRALVVSTGLLDATATALLLIAVREDLLSLVAPVAALYPAATVLLARTVQHERVGPVRAGGLALALAGLALIAIR